MPSTLLLLASILLWAIKVPASLLFALLTILLSPILPLFANSAGWLPRCLWWFQTPDNPLDGETFWIDAHPHEYPRRLLWLIRNAGYGFDWSVLSPRIPQSFDFTTRGNPATSNDPLHNGWCLRLLSSHDRLLPIWQLYYVRNYSATRCIRVNLGYKIWSNPKPGAVAPIVFSPSPFMGCSII